MGRVAPTFGTPTVTNTTVGVVWGVNGDTPRSFRIYRTPNNYADNYHDHDLQADFVNAYLWEGLARGTLYTFYVACVYADGAIYRGSFTATTTGTATTPVTPPESVRNFRVTVNDLVGFQPRVRLEWDRIDPRADGLALHRTSPGVPGFTMPFDKAGSAARAMTSFEDTAGLELYTRYRYDIFTYKGSSTDAVIADYVSLDVTTQAPPPAPMPPRQQDRWRWCEKCQGLIYTGVSGISWVHSQHGFVPSCNAGGLHDARRSGKYELFIGNRPQYLEGKTQTNWRWCSRCNTLAWGGGSGACHDGSPHDFSESGNYFVYMNVPQPQGTQSGWRWCKRCYVMAHSGSGNGVCHDSQPHDFSGSASYFIDHIPNSG